jgi:hypothetical protein
MHWQLRPKGQTQTKPPRELTSTEIEFLGRQDFDIEDRRRTSFVNELKKDPRFRPSSKPSAQTTRVRRIPSPVLDRH